MFDDNQVTHDTDDWPMRNPDPKNFHLRLFDSCYPECGAILNYEKIDFCPWCGSKLIDNPSTD